MGGKLVWSVLSAKKGLGNYNWVEFSIKRLVYIVISEIYR
jgi:hypothetical protein